MEIFKKYLITILTLLGLSFLFWLVFYRLEVELDIISNSIFFVNIIAFVIGLMLQTGSTRVFIGFNYSFKTLFKYKETKEKFDNFKEYYDDQAPTHKKNVMHILYVSGCLIFISILLSVIYMQTNF
jgi:hypothetical protein